jgi:hypothetical protein
VFNFVYPKVKYSLGKAALQDPWPACFLDPHGVITAANLLFFWLWDALTPGEPVQPDVLLGTNIFTVLAHNMERMPVDLNIEAFIKRSAQVKHAAESEHSAEYAPFIEAMKAHPGLAYIYETVPAHPENEWEYPLWITTPGKYRGDTLLKFLVTNYRLEGNGGFLVTYMPDATTLQAVEEQYSLLMQDFGTQNYVLASNTDRTQRKTTSRSGSRSPARNYYPTLTQDSLWYITNENKAQQLLVGQSSVGVHFFEMLFSPQLQEWMGPLQETTGPRAVRYFETFTNGYRKGSHELHPQYEQLMERLNHTPAFPRMLEISHNLKPYINLPENLGEPFYSCRVILPWLLSPSIMLHFRSIAQLLYEGLLVHTDEQSYQVTLVPEDYVTEVALILLYLAFTVSRPHDLAADYLKQILWLLTVLKTVQEGLTGGDEHMSDWEPDAAFARIYTALNATFSPYGGDAADQVIEEIKDTIRLLENEYMLKEELPLLLEGFLGAPLYAGLNLRESVEPVLKLIYP